MSTEPEFFINNNEPIRKKHTYKSTWFWLLGIGVWGVTWIIVALWLDFGTDVPDRTVVLISLPAYFIGYIPLVLLAFRAMRREVDDLFK